MSRLGAGRQHLVEIYVYESPVRLWHWVNALSLSVLAATGYLIGNPLWPPLAGEASDHFLMGYIRFTHFAAGYVFTLGLLGRLYWALVGNRWSRELFCLPVRDWAWWAEVWHQWRWYLFRVPAPKPYLGHDPLAQLVMFLMFTLPSGFMILTGFALYAEGLGQGSWADRTFGWLVVLMGQSQDVHTWHHLGMWVLICFTMIHVYAAFREELMAGRSILSAMISRRRILPRDPSTDK